MDFNDRKNKSFSQVCSQLSSNGSSLEKVLIRSLYQHDSRSELTVRVVLHNGNCPIIFEWEMSEFHQSAESLVASLETVWESSKTIRELALDLLLLPYFYGKHKQPFVTNDDKTNDSLDRISNPFNVFVSNPSLRILRLWIPENKDKSASDKVLVTREELSNCKKDFFEKLQHSFSCTTVSAVKDGDLDTTTTSLMGSKHLDEIDLIFPLQHSRLDLPPVDDLPVISKALSTCQVNKVTIQSAKEEELGVLVTEGIMHNSNIGHIALQEIYFRSYENDRCIVDALANHRTIKGVDWSRCDCRHSDVMFEHLFHALCQRNLPETEKQKTLIRNTININDQCGSGNTTTNSDNTATNNKNDCISSITSASASTNSCIVSPTLSTFSPLEEIKVEFDNLKFSRTTMESLVSFVTSPSSVCHTLSLTLVKLSSTSDLLVSLLEQATPTLTHLCLVLNSLTIFDGIQIATALTNNSSCCLEHLDISHNRIIEDSIESATAWKKYLTTTTTLKYWSHSISDSQPRISDAVRLVLEGLQSNVSIEDLNIGDTATFGGYRRPPTKPRNPIEALANGLQSTQTRLANLKVSTYNNESFTDSDWVPLAMALSTNTVLRSLNLHSSQIGNKTLQALGQSLRNNTTLHYVSIGLGDITEDDWEHFAKCVPYMSGLQVFEFSFDNNPECPSNYAEQIAWCTSQNTALRKISYIDQLSQSERWPLDLNHAGRSFFLGRTVTCMALWPRLVSRLGKKYYQWKLCCSVDPTYANRNQMPLGLLYALLRQNVDFLATIEYYR